jgi:hypothetical protein
MNAHLKRLLLNDLRDLKRQQEHAARGAANIDRGTVSLGANRSLVSNQKRINHGETILSKPYCNGSIDRSIADC